MSLFSDMPNPISAILPEQADLQMRLLDAFAEHACDLTHVAQATFVAVCHPSRDASGAILLTHPRWQMVYQQNLPASLVAHLENSIPNETGDPRTFVHDMFAAHQLTCATLTLTAHARVVGILVIATESATQPLFHSDWHKRLGEWIGHTLTRAQELTIEKNDLFAQTQQRLQELDGLAQLSAACASSLDPQTIIHNTLHWTRQLLRADIADIRWLKDKVILPVSNGTLGPALGIDAPVTWNRLWKSLVEQRAPVIIPDVYTYPLPASSRKFLIAHGIHAMLVMPLIVKDETFGMLSAIQQQPRRWSQNEIDLLRTITNQAANAIKNAQLFHQVLSERRQIKALFDSGINGMYVTDRAGRITMFNDAAVQMTGWPRAQVLGKLWQDVFAPPGNSNPTEETLIARVIRTRQNVYPVAGQMWHRYHKKTIPILQAAAPLLDEAGNVTGVVGTLWDLTREKQAEAERADLLEFFMHELRTPLTNLISIAQMLEKSRLTASQRAELLHILKVEGVRVQKFAQDFLNNQGVFALNQPIHLQPIALAPIIQTLVQQFRVDYRVHRFRLKLPRPTPKALADPLRAEHILRNLLENAVNYSPEDTVITVAVTPRDDWLEISVHDQGKGISPAERTLIFERYYRAKHSRGCVPGYGLGLAMVRQMVNEMGGKIWVESQPNQGTTFRFTLRRHV